MVTLFSSLIVIIISNKMTSIGLCLSVFDWICFSHTSNSCFERINVLETQPKTSRWFFWMLERVVVNSSGHAKHDRRLSIISRNLLTSSVLNFKINLVKHGRSCWDMTKPYWNVLMLSNFSKISQINLHLLVRCFWYNGWFFGKSVNECLGSSTYFQTCQLFLRSTDQRHWVAIAFG